MRRHEVFDRMTLAGDGGFAVGGRVGGLGGRPEPLALAGDGGFAVGGRAGGLGGRPEPPK